MTEMTGFEDEIFDVVIDKAAMDALVAPEGDVWNPEKSVIRKARAMCRQISRVLKPGGYHLQLSFQQPHFRKKYLLGWHEAPDDLISFDDKSGEFEWSFRFETIGGEGGSFQVFFYIMKKFCLHKEKT